MKRTGLVLLLCLLIAGIGVRLCQRWRDEHRRTIIALVIDWAEIRDLTARVGSATPSSILDTLKAQGATAVLIPAVTLDDLLNDGRIVPAHSATAESPLDTSKILFKDSALAALVKQELSWRGINDLQILPTSSGAWLQRNQGSFDSIKDIEAGFDPALIAQLELKGLVPLLRLNADPWMQASDVPSMLSTDPSLAHAGAILFNTDDAPGGREALPYWQAWLANRSLWIPLFEFHPAKSAWQLSMLRPGQSLRAHTIPSLELKDMQPEDILARWNRAALERSCRLFLVHASPNDSWSTYLTHLTQLRDLLVSHGWTPGWPTPDVSWNHPHHMLADFSGLLAFAIALMAPWWALQKGKEAGFGLRGFWITSLWTVLGGCAVAALGWNAWTRLEIVPLRGIKVAFLLSWLGSAFVIYRGAEIRTMLKAPVRRWDLVLGAVALAVVGYIMIRSGNASAAWKSSGEQRIRDILEHLLIARPRFKEFALGHPALLIGYFLERRRLRNLPTWDGRPWILVGMMGQASIVNTFCHLHSPLLLAFLRTFIGLIFGCFLGGALIILFLTSRKKIRNA